MPKISEMTAKSAPVGADILPILDSAASNANKRTTVGGVLAAPLTLNTQTGDYTLALADAGAVVEINSASAQVVTVPPNGTVAFPTGTVIEISRLGTGSATLAAGVGVTIRSAGSLLAIGAQYGSAGLRKRDTNEWVLTGDLV